MPTFPSILSFEKWWPSSHFSLQYWTSKK